MDVADWLRGLGLEQYAPAFRDNDIDEQVLRRLTAEDLTSLGVNSVGHRRKLLDAVAALEAPIPAVETPAFRRTPLQADPERRQLTVMFSDLVGSTALAARLDPEDLREIIAAYHRAVARVVKSFDGFVAQYMGDGVLVYFGYPQAHEDDAERAVRAGLAVVEAIAELNSGHEVALRTRVGIATGLVVVGDLIASGAAYELSAVGETPNLAARLQTLAEPNSVVIAASTRRLTGMLFEYRDLGTREIKGFSTPVSISQVLGIRTFQGRFEAQHGVGLTSLVGREEELDLLTRRWRQIQDGEGCVVLLTGEPGIGKSRIVREFENRLPNQAHARAGFFCSPLRQDSALFPVISYFEHAAGFVREDAGSLKLAKLEALLARTSAHTEAIGLIAELLSLPGDERYPVPQLTPQQRKEKTLEALLAHIAGLAATQPVLMLFEDVHWIDPTTRELLLLIVEQVQQLPVLVLVIARPEFVPRWPVHTHVTTLSLTRLTRLEGAALIERVAEGKALPAEVVQQILDRTDGIPLFIEELTKAVLESGLLQVTDDGYALTAPLSWLAIPTTLHDSLLARLDRLAPVKHVAQIGAAIGRDFSYSLLEGVARLNSGALREALSQLVRSELVFSHGEPPEAVYTFKHALVRDATYDTLLRGPRQELHARIVSVLEERFPEDVEQQPEILAQHCTLAGLSERAIGYWNKAGRKSLARSAMVEAAAQFQKGLDLLPGLPEGSNRQRQELELQSALGRALIASKGPASPETGKAYLRARAVCEELGDTGSLVPVLMGQFAHYLMCGALGAARQIADDLLFLGQSKNDAIARLAGHQAMGSCLHEVGDFAGAARHYDSVLSLYDPERHQTIASVAAYDPKTVALGVSALDLFIAGYPDRASARIEEAVSWSRKLNNYTTLCFALYSSWRFHLLGRSEQAALTPLQESFSVATKHRLSHFQKMINIGRVLVASTNEGIADRIAIVQQSINGEAERGVHHNHAYYLCVLAQAKERVGEREEALNVLARALEKSERTGERWLDAELHRLRGEWVIDHRSGEQAEAASCFERSLAVARQQGAKMWELRTAASLARLRRDQGSHGEGRELLASVYGWFTEGFDTSDLREAKALLDELT
ncbi:MAG TPA: AAA family ATPase [Stellaceae bacterium]|nr:AAA family ATPase [Stellaceae bacterium]